jgi:hypothetical protein
MLIIASVLFLFWSRQYSRDLHTRALVLIAGFSSHIVERELPLSMFAGDRVEQLVVVIVEPMFVNALCPKTSKFRM